MNIVSSVVGLAIMGTAMPMVSTMMIETVVAQKRAENFAVAETGAVTYSADHKTSTHFQIFLMNVR